MPGTGGSFIDSGAGPYVPGEPSPAVPLSPVELLFALLKRDANPAICPNVVVGPAEHAMQQQGVASITQAGSNQTNPHVPIIWARAQIRCVAHTVAHAEQIGMHVRQLLHARHRQVVTQPSSGNSYLVQGVRCLVDPSNHYDGVATWESLAFYEVRVHTTPVS